MSRTLEQFARFGRGMVRTGKSFGEVEHKLAGRYARRVRGQSMVELAITLPLLLLVLFGTIDLGRLSMQYITIANASREGARYGMTNSATLSNISSAVTNEGCDNTCTVVYTCAASASDPSNPASYNPSNCTTAGPGDWLKVTVGYNFQFVTLYFFGLSNITISDSTVMMIIK